MASFTDIKGRREPRIQPTILRTYNIKVHKEMKSSISRHWTEYSGDVGTSATELIREMIKDVCSKLVFNSICPIRSLKAGIDWSQALQKIEVSRNNWSYDTGFFCTKAEEIFEKETKPEILENIQKVKLKGIPRGAKWIKRLSESHVQRLMKLWMNYNETFLGRLKAIKQNVPARVRAIMKIGAMEVIKLNDSMTNYGSIFAIGYKDESRLLIVTFDHTDLADPNCWNIFYQPKAKIGRLNEFAEEVGDEKFLAVVTAAKLQREGQGKE